MDDSRNTDNAWIEADVVHAHVNEHLAALMVLDTLDSVDHIATPRADQDEVIVWINAEVSSVK
jgi:hypothetical protein